MTSIWFLSLFSVLLVSLLSLVGALTLFFKDRKFKLLVEFLVALSAGALLGDVFLHILPDMAADFPDSVTGYFLILLGLILFFVLEKFLRWGHCHELEEDHDHHGENKPLGSMTLFSDSLHNFLDGVIIGASYLVSLPLGVATTVAVILHEVPQEFGHFGILLHAGYSRGKALLYNLLSAMVAIVGTVVVLLVGESLGDLVKYVLPVAAGGFLYIAGSDLVPELNKVNNPKRSLLQFVGLILGILLMTSLLFLE